MTGSLHIFDNDRLLSAVGKIDGATVSFYYTGTSNLAPIYADNGLITPISNPVILGVGGLMPSIYLDPSITYRRHIVYNSDGIVYDVDPVFNSNSYLYTLQKTTGASLIGVDDGSSGTSFTTVQGAITGNNSITSQTTAQAQSAAASASTATTQAAIATAVTLGLPYFPLINASTAAGGSNVLPQGITSGTVGGTAITGATPGTYALTPTGGSFTGVQANLVVTSPTTATIQIVSSGRTTSASPTVPTWANPSGATIPSGTTLTANIGTLIGNGTGQYYLTSDSTGQNLLYWQNTGTSVPVAVTAAGGAQVSYPLSTRLSVLTPMAYDLDGAPWLSQDALTLTGAAAAYTWDANGLTIAKAVKGVILRGSGFNPAHNYIIQSVAFGHATFQDRIVIYDVTAAANWLSSGNVTWTKAASGATHITFTSSDNTMTVDIWIDYSFLATGNLYLTTGPTFISNDGAIQRFARIEQVTRARNIAFDGAGAQASNLQTWSVSTGTVAYVAANAALTAHGVVNAVNIGSGSSFTYAYNHQNVDLATINGKYVYRSCLVYSADGTSWPSGQGITAYSAPTSGGSTVSGVLNINGWYEQLTTNVRRYHITALMPASGTIGRIAHGFSTMVTSGGAAQWGGFTFAVSDSELGRDNVAVDDWYGYPTRDGQIATQAASILSLQSTTINNYPYGNGLTNGNGDPLYAYPGNGANFNSALYNTSPTSIVQREHGVKTSYYCGTAITNFWYNTDPVLNAASASQYWFASAYSYSPDTAQWAAPQIAFYAGSTIVGSVITMTNYIQIDANNRLYYASGQLSSSTSMTIVRMGCGQNTLTVTCEIGGFQFVQYRNPLTYGTTNRDDWYYKHIGAAALAAALAQVAAANPLQGKNIAWIGDSIVDAFNLPTLLAAVTGATVQNFGFSGLTLSESWSPNTGNNVYFNQLSGVALAASIASGNWTTPTAAAAALWAGGFTTHDYRPHIAAMAAYNWSTCDLLIVSQGTNDWGATKAAIGTTYPTDTTLTTINGALYNLINSVQTAFPLLPIIIGAPMWRTDSTYGDSNVNANSHGDMLSNFQAAILTACQYHQLPCWEPQKKVGFNQYNYGQTVGTGNSLFSTDGLHPGTTASQNRFISRFVAWLNSVV